jgi:ribonuclease HI
LSQSPPKSPYERELRQCTKDFITLLEQASIPASLDESSFRQYHVKLFIPDSGHIIIYYKPSKKRFTMSLHELKDKTHLATIERLWTEYQNPSRKAPPIQQTPYSAYVDGSYLEEKVGYGAVILHHDDEVATLSGRVDDAGKIRQVAGEIEAVLTTLLFCQQNGIEAVTIYYDYAGLENWATGKWQAKDAYTIAYQRAMQATTIEIHWRKVPAHSGNRWNNRADALAKEGALS